MPTAHEYAKAHVDDFRQQLVDLLRIPSVSTQPEHAADIQRAADFLVTDMKRIGMTRAASYKKEGCLPLVYGEWLGAGPDAPTLLIYSHYDVQPAALEDGWHTDPFDPTEQDGKIYARGAVDSKSHVIAQLKAVESMLAADTLPPVNFKLLFEGEEEADSEHTFSFVAEYKDMLKADVCVVSDGSMPDPNQPILDYGLRGLVTMELNVTGPKRDLHSGHYGGNVHNPIQALTEILAQLHDENGTVTVPGFYDGVLPLTEEERETLSEVGKWLAEEWKLVTRAPQPWGEKEYHLHERTTVRPTLEINGIAGGYYGKGFKTVLPSKATAKISCRLVPHQDPDHVFQSIHAAIEKLAPPTITWELIELEAGSPGILLDRDGPAAQAAVSAYEKGWGVSPLLGRGGGSIPVVSAFKAHLDIPVVLLPFGYKGGGAHGPNEYVIVDMFLKGIDTAIHYFHDYAELVK